MTQEGEHNGQPTRTAEIADGLAAVCGQLDELRAFFDAVGASAVLHRLLDQVRAGEDVTESLDAVHATLLRNGDAVGIYGSSSRGLGSRPLDLAAARPAEVVFLCPHRRCARLWWPDASAGETPCCAISGAGLRWERL
ncbi:hypothetical protein ACIRP7_45455 [Streptomyces sp. NPDC102270]|uniref:hypothetical protein n=1 Tax=Streptomyces sp. NPDC102270 TaxID=3366150 RepID=UPI0038039422